MVFILIGCNKQNIAFKYYMDPNNRLELSELCAVNFPPEPPKYIKGDTVVNETFRSEIKEVPKFIPIKVDCPQQDGTSIKVTAECSCKDSIINNYINREITITDTIVKTNVYPFNLEKERNAELARELKNTKEELEKQTKYHHRYKWLLIALIVIYTGYKIKKLRYGR